jgi:molecular chaperone GrpE
MSENQDLNGEPQNDLQGQLAAARQESKENHDKYLRALAESENMRKRLDRLCDERVWRERKRMVEHLLDVADHLEEALKYASAEDPLGAGIHVTYQQVQKVLFQEGVQVVPATGETFDPSMHEAIELTDSPGQENKVVREYRKGYTMDGKLLRAARVQVAKPE